MKAIDRIIRGRIQIQRKSPFFAYLSLYLKIQEDEKCESCAVDIDGNFYYNDKWVSNLDEKELEGVIIHEILHLGLLHLTRRNGREPQIWNIAADSVINKVIIDNGFSLPSQGIIPRSDGIVRLLGKEIDLNGKTAEDIYDELYDIVKKQVKKQLGKGKGKGKGNKDDEGNGIGDIKRFDEHREKGKGKDGKNKEGKDLTQEERGELEKNWLQKIEEAKVYSQMRGKLPLGIEQLIGKIHESRVNWRQILQRFIQNSIPYDYTYSKPNKKSISCDVYMPDYSKERIEVAVGIDTSGSIGNEELGEFLSEIIGIAKCYRNRIKMTLLTHDTEIHNNYLVENGNIEKIKALKFNGGGGTSHKEVLDKIQKDLRSCRIAIFLTDGFSDLENINLNKYAFEKVFVINKNGNKELKGKLKGCRIVEIK